MKTVLALLAAGPLAMVPPEEVAPLALNMPSYQEPAHNWRNIDDTTRIADNCRDTIRHVREANGQPALLKDTAPPGEPLLIAAVDQRIEGCSVMVMRHDTSDVRPLPAPSEGPARLIPAR